MTESEHTFMELYSQGEIAQIRRGVGGLKLTMTQVLQKAPNLTCEDLMIAAGMTLDPESKVNTITNEFKSLQRVVVQTWIDGSAGLISDEMMNRLNEELNSV